MFSDLNWTFPSVQLPSSSTSLPSPFPQYPQIFAQMKARMQNLATEGLPALSKDGGNDPRMCQVVEKTGHWFPYQD